MSTLFNTAKTSPPDVNEIVGRRKLGLSENFTCCQWEVIGPDALMVTLKEEYIISRGPKKGKRGWRGYAHKAIVTDVEAESEKLSWENLTGNCSKCGGDGQECYGWHHIEGQKFRECKRCSGSGKSSKQ